MQSLEGIMLRISSTSAGDARWSVENMLLLVLQCIRVVAEASKIRSA